MSALPLPRQLPQAHARHPGGEVGQSDRARHQDQPALAQHCDLPQLAAAQFAEAEIVVFTWQPTVLVLLGAPRQVRPLGP